jgi:hypothetical protein
VFNLKGLIGNSAPMTTLQIPGSLRAQDAATAGGLAFLVGELEKRDPKLREPMSSVTYARDIVIKTGGGWVENTSAYNVSYASSGGEDGGIIGGQTNSIPIMQADIGKDIFKTFNWAHILKVPFIDQQKMQSISRSLDDILDKGIRLNHDKTMDRNVYVGFPKYGTYGLVNNPLVTAGSAPAGTATTTTWKTKTPEEILNDINLIMVDTWKDSEYDLTGMSNHILIPPEQYAWLVKTLISTAGSQSILSYLLENNIGKNQDVDLFIAPCRWCIGAGVGGTDRMVAYAMDEDRIRVQQTVALSRIMTAPSVEHIGYLSAYAGQFGQVEVLAYSCIQYMDGI